MWSPMSTSCLSSSSESCAEVGEREHRLQLAPVALAQPDEDELARVAEEDRPGRSASPRPRCGGRLRVLPRRAPPRCRRACGCARRSAGTARGRCRACAAACPCAPASARARRPPPGLVRRERRVGRPWGRGYDSAAATNRLSLPGRDSVALVDHAQTLEGEPRPMLGECCRSTTGRRLPRFRSRYTVTASASRSELVADAVDQSRRPGPRTRRPRPD